MLFTKTTLQNSVVQTPYGQTMFRLVRCMYGLHFEEDISIMKLVKLPSDISCPSKH